MKRIFAMVLAVCMTLTLLPVSALAARSSREDQPLAEVAKGEESLDRAEAAAAKPAAEVDAQLAAADVSGEMSGSQLLATAAGGVITLTGDVTLTSKMGVNKDIVLDLNGHTVTATGSSYFNTIEVYSGKTLTVQDSGVGGKITDSGLTGSAFSADGVISSSGTLNLRGGTIESTKTNCVRVKGGATILDGAALVCTASMKSGIEIYQNAATTATAEIKSGTMESVQYGLNVGKNHNATMTGGTITVTGSQAHGVQIGGNCDVSLKNCTINATGSQSAGVYAGSNKVTLEDVVINGKSQAIFLNSECAVTVSGDKTHLTGTRVIVLNNGWSDSANSSLIITGGTVEGKIDRQGLQKLAKPVITGGTFTTDVSDYCAEGFEVRLKDDGSYDVIEKTVVAQITRDGVDEPLKFYTLQDALAAAQEGETVTMVADETVPVWYQVGKIGRPLAKNVTIEGNEHTLTIGRIESNGNGSYITYGAEGLTVKDLTVDQTGVGNGGFSIGEGSKLEYVTVKGGSYGALTGSNVTIDHCTFTNVAHAIYTNEEGEGTGLKITNNTFTDGRAIILRSDEVFTGNTVTHNDTMLTVDTTEATVTNNKFSGSGKLSLYADTNVEGNAILCGVKTGSNVTVDLSDNYWGESEPTGLPESVTVASRYTEWDEDTKTASVPTKTDGAVAQVGDQYYATLAGALTAANAAEDEASRTVTLLTGDAQTIDLSNYGDGLTNVTLTAAEGVKCAGIKVTKTGDGASSMTNFTFKGIHFNAEGFGADFDGNAAKATVENITFEDCAFTCVGKNESNDIAIHMYGGKDATPYKNVVVKNCEFVHCGQGVYVNNSDTLTVTGCTFTDVGAYGTNGVVIHPGDVSATGKIVIDGNALIDCINCPFVMFQLGDDATVEVKNNTFTHIGGRWMLLSNAVHREKFAFSGNTWDGIALGTDKEFDVGEFGDQIEFGAEAAVEVYAGENLVYKLATVESAVYFANKEDNLNTIKILAAGEYDLTGLAENVTVTVPDGYVQKTEGNTLTVVAAAAQVIAATDGAATAYATVAEALAASNPGDTLKLLAQPEGAKLVIPDDKAVQIDKNGFDVSIRSEAEAYGMQLDPRTETFRIYGGFYQVMEGEAALRNANVGTAYGYTFFALNQDLTLTQDVTLPMRNAVGSCISVDKAGTTVTLDLAGYTITQTPGDGINSFPAVRANRGNLVITDSSETEAGKIIGAMLGAQTYDDASLTLESGTISTLGKHYGNTYGSVVYMFGGTFNMTGGSLVTEDIGDEDGIYSTILLMTLGETYTVNISGGMIQSVPGGVIYATANTATENTYHITGGTFDLDLKNLEDQVGNSYLDAGYCTAQNQDGTYTVGAHALTETTAKPATCTEAGNTAYWSCNHCGKLFSDAQGATEIQPANTVIAALGHNTNGVVQHKAPTCTEAGVVGGTYCTNCEEGKQAALAPIPVDLNAHDLKWSFDETNHWHECSNCDYEETHAAHAWVQGAVSGGRRTDICECGATRTVNVSTGGNSGSRPSPTPTPDPVVDPEPQPPEEDLDEPDVPLTDKPFLFTDVKADDWFYDAVKFVAAANIMVGVDKANTTFAPMQNTTRGTVATLIHRMEETPDAKLADFSDVLSGAWYTEAVNWTDDNGVMIGFPDGTFRPEAVVTREQLALVFYRYAKFLGYDVSAADDLSAFVDAEEVGDWAEESMAWAVGTGLIQGRGGARLAPQSTTTRGELATMLRRFLELKAPVEQ